jgi:cation diffusion facilitator family transporter
VSPNTPQLSSNPLARVPVLERNVAVGALALSLVLTTVKFWAYAVTGSAAVFSDAVESIVNVLAGGFALYAVVMAHTPPDRDHPYGHGKIEFLSAAFEGGMIFLAGAVVAWRAFAELAAGPEVTEAGRGAVLLAAASVGNLVGGLALLWVGRRRGSIALEADGKHLLSDVVTTAGVLLALWLVHLTGWKPLDPVCALGVSGYLFWTAYGLIRRASAGLMDEQDTADDRLLRKILESHVRGETPPRICSYHKVRHRHTGRMHWVDFHMQVPGETTTRDAHEMAGAIEGEIERALEEADATAHVEPCEGCDMCGGSVGEGTDSKA